jgi:hypothetical protein
MNLGYTPKATIKNNVRMALPKMNFSHIKTKII